MLVALLLVAALDDFDRLEGPALRDAVASPEARPQGRLTFDDLAGLPNVLRDSRSALIAMRTDAGNLARLLVSPAYKKAAKGGEPVPVLLVERLDCFEAGPATKRIAKARDLILYDGFLLDLDSGGVVPEGQGGDVRFSATGPGGPALEAIAPGGLLTFAKSPAPPDDGPGRPSPGREVKPGDFAGRYRIVTNGQGSGRLELKVEGKEVTGRITSEQTGGSYPVEGRVGDGGANRVRFTATLPRVREEFDGLLFSEGKGAIVGSYTLLDRTFGFLAIREGGALAPDGEDVAGPIAEAPASLAVEVTRDAIRMEGKPIEADGLGAAIREALAREPGAWVRLSASDDVPFARVRSVLDRLREAAPEASIRLAPAEPRPGP